MLLLGLSMLLIQLVSHAYLSLKLKVAFNNCTNFTLAYKKQ